MISLLSKSQSKEEQSVLNIDDFAPNCNERVKITLSMNNNPFYSEESR